MQDETVKLYAIVSTDHHTTYYYATNVCKLLVHYGINIGLFARMGDLRTKAMTKMDNDKEMVDLFNTFCADVFYGDKVEAIMTIDKTVICYDNTFIHNDE